MVLRRWLRDRSIRYWAGSSSEHGFTILEVTVSLFISTILLGLMLSAYAMGSEKSVYIIGDSELVRFEQTLGTWIDTDFRENRILSIDQTEFDDGRITFKIEDLKGEESTVVYENRPKGYYRVKDSKALLLSDQRIERVSLENNVLALTYYIDNADKTIRIKLVK